MKHLAVAAVLVVAGHLSACGATPAPRRVEEARYVPLGSEAPTVEQWVTIRGHDDRNPMLLLVHGGPGDVQSPFVSTYAPYERDFVLVQWDERGAGRTFVRNGAAGVSLAQQITDGIALATRLHQRFPRSPLIVLGHSWGSVVATGMAQQRPDLFAAYVGTGQVAAWTDTVQFQFDFLKDVARKHQDAETLAKLEAIGTPDPLDVDQYFGFSWPLRKHLPPPDAAWLAGLLPLAKANGETDASIQATTEGMAASGKALIQATIRTDLPATASTFQIPYYLIQGRHDVFAPTPLAEAYFARVSAPRKQLVILEDAGHFALATHAAEFAATLKRLLDDSIDGRDARDAVTPRGGAAR